MTIGEISRRVDSYNRMLKAELQRKASFDYQLANLIGMSVGRCLSSDAKFPDLYEAYEDVFDAEEVEEYKCKKVEQQSIANFMNFAIHHNLKKGVE